LSAGLAFLLSLSASIAQETDKRKATNAEGVTATRIEPLRVINGELRGRAVFGSLNHGAQLKDFVLTFTKAEVINRSLQLRCDFSVEGGGARLSYQVSATIAGAIAAAANPWPRATEEQRKDAKKPKEEEKKPREKEQGGEAKIPEAAGQLGQLAQSTQETTRKAPPATGEKTAQTQTHDAQSETVTGCGVIFLKLMLPQRLRARMGAVAQPVQLGVVLKPFDNDLGKEVVKEICGLVQNTDPRGQSASLDQLNSLLSSK